MELEVGMYVRTICGIFGKILCITNFYKDTKILGLRFVGNNYSINDNKYGNCFVDGHQGILSSDVIKASFNIIDIIETGDYVNGHKVCMDLITSKKFYNSENNFITCNGYTFESDEIETILTKEQFESIKYEVR